MYNIPVLLILIRIEIGRLDPDPDSGEPTKRKKVEKCIVLKCWISLLRAGGFSYI
jgi:hypothetical protein